MIRFRKAIHIGMVWLTAVMTLTAAFPQFACACPGGEGRILLPLATTLSTNRCPCEKGCDAASSMDPKRKCCCCESERAQSKPSQPTQSAPEQSCKKVATVGESFVPTSSAKTAGLD